MQIFVTNLCREYRKGFADYTNKNVRKLFSKCDFVTKTRSLKKVEIGTKKAAVNLPQLDQQLR